MKEKRKNNMNSKDYISKELRTEARDHYDNFFSKEKVDPRIEHAMYGLVTEVGEIMDQLKRSKVYNTQFDKVNLIEEMGDMMWYMAILCDAVEVSFEELWDRNIEKLKIRYPEKYSDIKALKRDLSKERKILERK